MGRLGKWNENRIVFAGGGHRHSGGLQGRLIQGDAFSTYAIRNAATAGAATARRRLAKFWWIRGTTIESAGAAVVGTVDLSGLFNTIDIILITPHATNRIGTGCFTPGYATTGPASFVAHGMGITSGVADIFIVGR